MLPSDIQVQNPLALLRQLEWRVRHAVENILSGRIPLGLPRTRHGV